jgi:prepilin-type N-terminal cleavage/methylation domain-containing protein
MTTYSYATSSSTKTHRGFTLIETLIAITVLTLSIVGPFQIVQGVLNSAYNSRDQLIGAGLAQEAMEYVREVRDSNYLYNVHGGAVSWLYGFDGTGGLPNCYSNVGSLSDCSVDPQKKTINACGSVGCTPGPLYIEPNTYLYTQQTVGTVTKFTRTVRMTQISASETLVTVTVTWQNHGSRSVVLQEYIRNWL